MTQSESQETESKRYSRLHPPPDEQAALARLDILYDATTRMATQLEFAELDSFPDDEEYELWRDRTIRQLAALRCETTFIERWLQAYRVGGTTFPESPVLGGSHLNSLSAISNQIRALAERLAAELRGQYQPLYSQINPPPDLASAHRRIAELTILKLQTQGAFAQITAEWTKYPLDRDDLSGIKAPVQIVLVAIEIEMVCVKEFIRANAFDWKSPKGVLCINAVMRAIEQGFIVSSDERAALDHLREKFVPPQPS